MEGIKVSIITVTFNAAASIEQTLKSVIGQSYDNMEYLIIDGGSRDETMAIVNKYRANIDMIVSEPDKGLYDAMNKGARLATGDWVLFLNSGDCFFDANTVVTFFSHYNLFHSRIIAYGDIQLLYPQNVLLNQSVRNPRVQSICHQGQFIKRKDLLALGGYDQQFRIYADFDFQRRVYLENEGSLIHIPVTVASYENVGLSALPFYRYYKEYLRVGKNNSPDQYDMLLFRFYAIKAACASFIYNVIRKLVKSGQG